MNGKPEMSKLVTEQQQWYVQKGSRVQGPFTATEVGRYLLLGRVRNTDRVSKDGELWEPVTQVPELIPEELLDLDSEQGWQSYLQSQKHMDERAPGLVAVRDNERRDMNPDHASRAVREEWRTEQSANQPSKNSGSPELLQDPPRSVSLLPLSLLGITLGVLLLIIYLNSTNTIF